MATYKITAPDGRTLKVTGDSPPSEQELEEIFKGIAPGFGNVKAGASSTSKDDLRPGSPEFEAIKNQAELEGTAAAAGPQLAILGSALGGQAATMIPGAVGAAARYAMARPMATGAVLGAAPDALRGNVPQAVEGGTIGALLGATGRFGKVLKAAGRFGSSSAARAAVPAAEASMPAIARSTTGMATASATSTTPRTIGGMIATEAPKVRSLTSIQRDFAKAATKDLARGAKVHLKLDADGLPVDVITSDQAAKLPEHLKTWLRKTW
jgi:hypothetical protein